RSHRADTPGSAVAESKEEVGVRKRLLAASLAAVAGALVVTAVGSGGTSTKQVTPLPASSCSPVVYKGSGSPKFLLASDLPLQGSGRTQTIEMTKAIQCILNG